MFIGFEFRVSKIAQKYYPTRQNVLSDLNWKLTFFGELRTFIGSMLKLIELIRHYIYKAYSISVDQLIPG